MADTNRSADAALTRSLHDTVRAAITRSRDEPGRLLEVLHGVQDALGHVPPEAVPLIADALNLSRAEVHGVISFYHHFRRAPPGRHIVQICRAEACQSMNARALEQHAQRRFGITWHGTTADGAVTLEPVYCLGNCACAPAVMIGGELHGRVTPQRFDELVGRLEAGT